MYEQPSIHDLFDGSDPDLIEKHRCPYCGLVVEEPCEEPPPDTCEKALNVLYP